MKLLIVTQAVDRSDPVLGFFHEWIRALATRFERIEVICLKEGEHDLPANVAVHSLGKERGSRGRLAYALRFLALSWKLRREYDAAFVHMNQEYLLLAGPLWKLLRKPAYLWRNHYAGNFLTDLAASFCTKVFCTSMHSHTAKYRKTRLMPVGVDLARFGGAASVRREPRSILFFARMAPSKRPDMFLDALGILLARGVSFVASLYGSPLPEDQAYYDSLKARAESLGLHDRVRFHPGVPNAEAPRVFSVHEIFVNCSPSGMFDKTIFEAAASGCVVLAMSDDFAVKAGEEFHAVDAEGFADRLAEVLSVVPERLETARSQQEVLARRESLDTLVDRLAVELGK